MAPYPTAEEEKRLLDTAEEVATATAPADTESQTKRRSCKSCKNKCRKRMAKRVALYIFTSMLIAAWCILAYGVTSFAVGAWRHAHSCSKPGMMAANGAPAHMGGAPRIPNHAAGSAKNAHVADAADASSPSAFSRLLEAVSPEALHDLLHLYFPNTYKHGVYPSEKSAMEAIHRANAPLATSMVQLARRDISNSTISSAPSSTAPTSSLPTNRNTSTTHATTPTSTTSTSSLSSGRKVTSTYTSTINGTPTVVTATSVVGVGAGNTGGGSTPTGSLQTGAADALLARGNKAHLAEAVAGVLVGALLI